MHGCQFKIFVQKYQQKHIPTVRKPDATDAPPPYFLAPRARTAELALYPLCCGQPPWTRVSSSGPYTVCLGRQAKMFALPQPVTLLNASD